MKLVLPPEWNVYSDSIDKVHVGPLCAFLIQLGRTPASVQESDLECFITTYTAAGGSYEFACRLTSRMRKIFLLCQEKEGPSRMRSSRPCYGVSLRSLPEPIRTQVTELCENMPYAYIGTSTRRPGRHVSAKARANAFCRLYGYGVNIAGCPGVTSIEQLVVEPLCRSYSNWMRNERQALSSSVIHTLTLISGTLMASRQHASIRHPWLAEFISSIPRDSEEMIGRRKDRKFLAYESLTRIPEILRQRRMRMQNIRPRRAALAIRDELLMRWLAILPWRQGIICALSISGAQANLYRDTIPQRLSVARPSWADSSSDSLFWQLRFSPAESSTRSGVRLVLPRCLVGNLNEYLTHARPVLVRPPDPGTLFLGLAGRPLKNPGFRNLVAALTLRTCGRVVTPKAYRDIFARMYLEKCPNDYLTLSKLLWHKSILTTLRLYGRPFDESAALCRVEHMLHGTEGSAAVSISETREYESTVLHVPSR